MKGPSERLKYDLRRVWKCPVCGHLERTSGNATTQLCKCQMRESVAPRQWMRLIEDGARRVLPSAVSSPMNTIPVDVPTPSSAEPNSVTDNASPAPDVQSSTEGSDTP